MMLYRQFATQEEIDKEYDVERSVPDFQSYAEFNCRIQGYLHHQLLHQQPEHSVSDSAGMAGSPCRDLLPDPLGSLAPRHRLEQWHTGDDLRQQGGIRCHLPELRGPEKSVAGFSFGLRAAEVRNRRRLVESQGVSVRDAKHSYRGGIRWDLRQVFQSLWSSDELVGVRTQGAEAWNLRVQRRGELPEG
jgi:hypothetical protein